MTSPIPEGYPRVTPYLIVDGGAEAIDFYKKVLGASERMRMAGPDGRIGHAELEIGDGIIMLADENPEMGSRSPGRVGGTPVMIHVYLENVDDAFERARAAGSTILNTPEDRFYGDRSASFEDPFGHRWDIATHVEDVSPEEMQKRAAEMMASA
jgi:PhnB protein